MANDMNFLAHLYLSSDEPEALLGSILPDLVRGRLKPDLPTIVRQACQMHQAIDLYTDHHPLFAQSRDRFRPTAGRLAGVVADIFYDHLLASRWRQYHPAPLADFAQATYRALRRCERWLPQDSRHVLERMIEHDWLTAYSRMSGMTRTLQGMSHRLTTRFNRPIDLSPCVHAYVKHQQALRADFECFFPQVHAFAAAGSPHVSRRMTDGAGSA